MYRGNFIRLRLLFPILIAILILSCCKKEDIPNNDLKKATPYNLVLPKSLKSLPFFIPVDNPLTVEGVELGRFLFFDSMLSKDYSISCGSCHHQEFAFSNSPEKFSKGIMGQLGKRNSMNLFNLAFQKGPLFWDGREPTLEAQIIQPVIDPVEMANTWDEVLRRFNSRPEYLTLYEVAFQTKTVSKENLAKAIAQFLRTIVSGNSIFDRQLTGDAAKGEALFAEAPSFADLKSGIRTSGGFDCAHCHTAPLFQPEDKIPSFLNNGNDGTFRVPSLRNLSLTAPYMHDGRFSTIDEVIKHYENVQVTPDMDDNMWRKVHTTELSSPAKAKLNITPTELKQLKAFLNSLNDDSLIVKKEYSNPFRK